MVASNSAGTLAECVRGMVPGGGRGSSCGAARRPVRGRRPKPTAQQRADGLEDSRYPARFAAKSGVERMIALCHDGEGSTLGLDRTGGLANLAAERLDQAEPRSTKWPRNRKDSGLALPLIMSTTAATIASMGCR